jgi:hypothetical protein
MVHIIVELRVTKPARRRRGFSSSFAASAGGEESEGFVSIAFNCRSNAFPGLAGDRWSADELLEVRLHFLRALSHGIWASSGMASVVTK